MLNWLTTTFYIMKKEYAEYLLGKTGKDYDLIAFEFSKRRMKPWKEAKFLFDKYILPGDRVLDAGCGCGQYAEFVKERGGEYFGADVSKELIGIAKKRHPGLKFQTASVLNLPFPKNLFDKVYAIALLHAIPSQEFRTQALEEMKRVLKRGGLLILSVWDLYRKKKKRGLILKFAFLKLLGKSKLDFGDILTNWQGISDCYFHCFTKEELKKAARKSGFEVVEEGKFSLGKKQGKNSNFYLVAHKGQQTS